MTDPSAGPRPAQAAHRHGVIRRAGLGWFVAIGAQHAHVGDLMGMAYLAELLTRPGRDIPAVVLASGGEPPRERARQDLLDDAAKAAYAARARELADELAEAEANNDIARAEKLHVELDALVEQLETASGLGGRPRTFSDSAERARTAVRKAVRRALDAVDAANPVVAEALRSTVRTGTTCVYTPDATHPVVWATSGPAAGPDDLPTAEAAGPPTWLTRFFGRQDETAELEALVEGARLLTLVGSPGAGKTRLAAELATRLTTTFADRVWFVELAPLSDPMSVASAVAAATGTSEEPGRTARDTLAEAFGDAECLVVLDNCEHLVDATAGLVGHLIATCPRLRVVATSRVPLGVPGEQQWRVEPLDADTALELFVDRSRLTRGGFEVDDTARPVVEEICHRLAGLPLAIELAAAWVRVLSPGEILDRLADGGLLRSAARGAEPRQATMEATIDWSYQLLGQAERTLFERLSVFSGGFDLEAARAVAGLEEEEDDGDLLLQLSGLVDQSLVLADEAAGGAMRYRLLEPVRHYGAAALAAGSDQEIIQRRHAEHYLGVALRCDAELWGDRRAGALQRLQLEEGNLSLALHWTRVHAPEQGLRMCTALATFWELGGSVNEGRAWFERMLAVEVEDRQLRSRALARAARLAWRHRDYRQARRLLDDSLAIKRELGDQLGVARRLRSLALVTMTEGDVDAAVDLCEQCITLFRAHGDDTGLVWALVFLGLARYIAGDLAGGDDRLDEALVLNEGVGSASATAYGLLYRCYGAKLAGDAAAERKYLVAAISAMRDASGILEEPDWLWASTSLALSEGRTTTAFRLAGGAEALSRRTGSHMNEQFSRTLASYLDEAAEELGPVQADRLRAEGARAGIADLLDEAVSQEPDPPCGELPS